MEDLEHLANISQKQSIILIDLCNAVNLLNKCGVVNYVVHILFLLERCCELQLVRLTVGEI